VRGDSLVWAKLIDQGGDFLVNLAEAALIVVVTFWAAAWAGRLSRRLLERLPHHKPPDATLQIFVASLTHNIVVVLGGVAVLQQLGVKTTSIIAALGAASLAVGLALQGALSNVAAGVMILVFRPYRVGDLIETAGRQGRVLALDLFVTELATVDELKVVVPNSKIFTDVIVNHSFHARRRADVQFHLPLAVDLTALMARLRSALDADPRVLPAPAPILEVTSISETFVELAVRPWVARENLAAVKADVLLWAHALEADPASPVPPRPAGDRAAAGPSH
jgi:small conductance mechanosensitive channel